VRRLVNIEPGRGGALLLGALPFLLLAVLYLMGSHYRLAENPNDKLLPAPSTLASTVHTYAMEEDKRSGEVLWWVDTIASLKRIGLALVISAALGLALGVVIGALPIVRAAGAPFVSALAMIPPLAVLPILFIVVGLGEVAKVTLIVIGVTPCIA
jgi:NitT/TauT family transport system permease protein